MSAGPGTAQVGLCGWTISQAAYVRRFPLVVLVELCRDLDLVHVVDPMQTETVTPEHTYYRLHGTTGSRHVHSSEELRRLRDLVADRPDPAVLFNNLPRVGDAERFLDLL